MYRVEVKWDRAKFEQVLIDSAKASIPIITEQIKANVTQNADIDIYEDRGLGLSKILQKTGLDAYTIPGQLKNGFMQMVGSIPYTHYKKRSTITIFNSFILDTNTKWYGISIPLRTKRTGMSDNIANDDIINDSNFKFSIIENGYRPLPVRGGGFTFTRNPYSERGYWAIKEKGYTGENVDYAHSDQLAKAYRGIVRTWVSMISEVPIQNIYLQNFFLDGWGKKISELTNNALRTA
jgi:hypothetical protein